jgi:uncharacterized membrane protein
MFFSNFNQINNPTFNFLRDLATRYWISDLRFFGHFFFVSLFLLISGISFTFSKSNLSRGLKLLAVAMVITLVTYLLDVLLSFDTLIVFGIIHLFAVSILLTYVIRKLIKNDFVVLLIGSLIIIYGISFEFWKVTYAFSFDSSTFFDIIIGKKAYGSDYFGLAPYMGMLVLGTVVGNTLYKEKESMFKGINLNSKNLFMLAGRYSLWIFVFHQIVLITLLYIIGYFFGYRF